MAFDEQSFVNLATSQTEIEMEQSQHQQSEQQQQQQQSEESKAIERDAYSQLLERENVSFMDVLAGGDSTSGVPQVCVVAHESDRAGG